MGGLSQTGASTCITCAVVVFLLHLHCTLAQEQLRQVFYVPEGEPLHSTIGVITTLPPPFMIFSNTNADVDRDLNINENSGEITNKKLLDRESRPFYSFLAVSYANGETAKIEINITDINDNVPTFSPPFLKIELAESTPRDVKISLGSATDNDRGINTTQRYEIASGNTNNAFRLSSKRAKNGILYLDLEINGYLDYETTPYYTLMILAYDGGSPPLIGNMTVEISIVDSNDNQPIFNQSRYFAQVPEDAEVERSVLQVFASDLDQGENGHIQYNIDYHQSNPSQDDFTIDSTNGIIFVNRQLDFEKVSMYELVVVARDNGTQPLQTTAIVSITIKDKNDNEPQINMLFLTEDGTAKISELASPGDAVARISVSDPDVGEYYANVSVSIEGGNGHFGLITQDDVIYLVVVSKPPDREIASFYDITVIAQDSGSPPLYARTTFELKIIDSNDNAPSFSEAMYYTDIAEVASPGSSVFQLHAEDTDEGDNALITYHLKHTPETHSDWFKVDENTGLITTDSEIDCETNSEPRLYITAMDSGSPRLSANCTVVVRIRDINDNQPIFDMSFYNVTVDENEPVDNCILTKPTTTTQTLGGGDIEGGLEKQNHVTMSQKDIYVEGIFDRFSHNLKSLVNHGLRIYPAYIVAGRHLMPAGSRPNPYTTAGAVTWLEAVAAAGFGTIEKGKRGGSISFHKHKFMSLSPVLKAKLLSLSISEEQYDAFEMERQQPNAKKARTD